MQDQSPAQSRFRLVKSGQGSPSAAPPPLDFARLREDLKRAVARVCPPWLVDRSEDLVQMASMRLMEIHRKNEGNVEFSSFYLRRAAYSAVIDEIRRLKRRQEVSLDDEDNEVTPPPAESPDPERLTRGRQTGQAIRECMGRMVRPRRLAVTLHLQGHSVGETAKLLGWNAKKAENLVYRGLADLRGCLTAKGIGI
jgi:RNA polymerase sigma-70 factor (ECF subfamily)